MEVCSRAESRYLFTHTIPMKISSKIYVVFKNLDVKDHIILQSFAITAKHNHFAKGFLTMQNIRIKLNIKPAIPGQNTLKYV